jgi:hypothetical protein
MNKFGKKRKRTLKKPIKKPIKKTRFGGEPEEPEEPGEQKDVKKDSFYKRNKKAVKGAAIATGVVVGAVATHYIAKRFSPRYAKAVSEIRIPKVQLPSFLKRKKAEQTAAGTSGASTQPINEVHEVHKEEDATYNERKQELLTRQKSSDPQEQRDARVEFDQLQRERTERLRERDQFKREEAARIKQELDEQKRIAEQEKKERKNPIEWVLHTSAKITELRNDPLVGPILEQLFKEIPKLMESFEEKDKEDTEHALEDIKEASVELNEVDENDEKEIDKKKKKLKDAEDNLNLVNQRKERYNEITQDIKYQKELLSKEKNKKKQQEILKNLGELQEQLKDLIKNKEPVQEPVEEIVEPSKRTKKTRTRNFGKLKPLKRLKRDLLVLRNL